MKYKDYQIENLDISFKLTNQKVALYCETMGLPLTFDFSDSNNKVLYTHFFLKDICEFIKSFSTQKTVFYNNTMNKDEFRTKLINKIRKIFGFKIFDGVWEYSDFCQMIKNRDVRIIDKFELLLECNCKPKNLKHIKKYLDKEGLTNLGDVYFQEIANKMIILC